MIITLTVPIFFLLFVVDYCTLCFQLRLDDIEFLVLSTLHKYLVLITGGNDLSTQLLQLT